MVTKEVIRLCKRIAKKHRKDLKVGMYVWREFDKTVQLIYRLDEKEKDIYTVILKTGKLEKHYWNNLEGGWFTPLWTIPDCVEFLRKKGFMVRLIEYKNWRGIKRIECNCYGHKTKEAFSTQGNKDEEACLRAVLAVFKKEDLNGKRKSNRPISAKNF